MGVAQSSQKMVCCSAATEQAVENVNADTSTHEPESPLPEGMFYPMMLVTMDRLMKMSGAPTGYQDLLEEQALIQYVAGMYCIFVSHQWVSNAHPDPEGKQLSVLQLALNQIFEKGLNVGSSIDNEVIFKTFKTMKPQTKQAMQSGFAWYDWFGIPNITKGQAEQYDNSSDLIKAMSSIPAYVEACNMFLVMAPVLKHYDTGTLCSMSSWRTRGWCRVEMACSALSKKTIDDEIIMVTSPMMVKYMSTNDWVSMLPGNGDFTVDSDRRVVGNLAQLAIERRLRFELQQASNDARHMLQFRLLTALRSVILEGLLPAETPSDVVQDFLAKYRFKALTDIGDFGVGSLLCAAVEDNVPILRQVLHANADIDRPLEIDIPELMLNQGATPLAASALFGSLESVKFLLEQKASVEKRNAIGASVMNYACFSSSPKLMSIVRLLMEHRADPYAKNDIGTCSLISFLVRPSSKEKREVFELLLKPGNVANSQDIFGSSLLHYASLFSANNDCTRLLIKYRADVNAQAAGRGFIGPSVTKLSTWLFACGVERESTRYFSTVRGATPLHIACMYGDAATAEILLDAKADCDICNEAGLTPLDCARRSHFPDLLKGHLSAAPKVIGAN
eukprot:TRINITY_DN8258_c0_g4_i1.p1 TRINITY_DN8258_c0_g4~~TRINITY_DN8258_c0_g4_i1.p1  ORF type:complete len:619 (-),score=110.23 TRINITY_DN8258_c0_g4_i1:24-1880(-)